MFTTRNESFFHNFRNWKIAKQTSRSLQDATILTSSSSSSGWYSINRHVEPETQCYIAVGG